MKRAPARRSAVLELPLVGPAGEPVDLARTCLSHGIASLPPNRVAQGGRAIELALGAAGRARCVRIEAGGRGHARITVHGPAPGAREQREILAAVRRVLALDQDLTGFYRLAAADPELAWAARGAGRIVCSPSVFEDVVKTICTTNCAWSATVRMVTALVEGLGEPVSGENVAGEPAERGTRRAFPTPESMARAPESFYRDVARTGYRGAYLARLAASVAEGKLDLEALRDPALGDDEARERLLELPGVGPYAAAQIAMLLGRHSRLVLDSWSRPQYARLAGKKRVSDRTIERCFRAYGPWAGLAFWLTVTRDWV